MTIATKLSGLIVIIGVAFGSASDAIAQAEGAMVQQLVNNEAIMQGEMPGWYRELTKNRFSQSATRDFLDRQHCRVESNLIDQGFELSQEMVGSNGAIRIAGKKSKAKQSILIGSNHSEAGALSYEITIVDRKNNREISSASSETAIGEGVNLRVRGVSENGATIWVQLVCS